MVVRLFYLSCVSYSLFELPVLVHHTIWLPFQLSSQLFSASRMFLFHLLFLEFLLQAVHIFFCSFFPLMQLCLNSLFTVTVSLYSIVSAAFTPSINGSTEFLTCHPRSFFFHPYASLTTYQSPCSHFPVNITFVINRSGPCV